MVLEKTFENIELVVDLSGADHVEDLHEYKGCEYDGHVSGWAVVSEILVIQNISSISIWSTWIDHSVFVWDISWSFWDEEFSGKNDSEHNDCLEYRHA